MAYIKFKFIKIKKEFTLSFVCFAKDYQSCKKVSRNRNLSLEKDISLT